MHMNQVAIAYRTAAERTAIIHSLGLADAEWVKDKVKARVRVLGRHGDYSEGENVAELEFCMAMGGTQFELIRYTDGPNWISEAARIGVTFPMVAHVGFHLDENEDWPPIVKDGVLAQEAITVEHSNEEVNKAGRRYHYRIYRVGTGAYFKFIKRLTVGKDHHEAVKGLEPRKPEPVQDQLPQPQPVPATPVVMPVPANPGLADPDHPTSDAAKDASEQAIKDAEARAAADEARKAEDERLRLQAAGVATEGDHKVGAATSTEGAAADQLPAQPGLSDAEHSQKTGETSQKAAESHETAGDVNESGPKVENKEPATPAAKAGPAPTTTFKGKRK